MSKTVDNRVVQLEFDNKQFESNIRESLKSLENLKRGLNVDKSAKSLEKLGSVGKSFSLAGIADGVQSISDRFSALGVVGMTALQNLTNSAIDVGKRVISAFTIDPIKSGFEEYETQINAVQTIMANTQKEYQTDEEGIQKVNAALDELNHYADMTIYNFTEMTRNIGTFTAAGVDLKTSTAAIKGIANLAAVSGSTSQQASTAMYQLSQALASGVVNLQDWNSVVNAGMGGQVFQDALKETAKVHGVAIDQMIEHYGSFRESLSKGKWLTKDVLIETLQKFTGDLSAEQLKSIGYTEEQIQGILKLGQTANDAATKVKTFTQLVDTLKEAAQSGWTQSWEILIGDFGEAKELYTKISDVLSDFIGKSADARNTLLEGAFGKHDTLGADAWKQFSEAADGAGVLESAIKSVAKTHGIDIDKMIQDSGSFADTLSDGWLNLDMINEALTQTGTTTETVTNNFEELKKVAEDVYHGLYGDDKERKKALKAAGYDYEAVQAIVNHNILGTELNLEKFSKTELKAVGYTEEEAKALQELAKQAKETGTPLNELIETMSRPSGRDLMIEAGSNFFQTFLSIAKPVKNAWDQAFPPVSIDRLYGIIKTINEFSKSVKNAFSTKTVDGFGRVKSIFDGVSGILSVFKLLVSIGTRVLHAIFPLSKGFVYLGDGVLSAFGAFGLFLTTITGMVEQSHLLSFVIDTIGFGVSRFIELFKFVVETVVGLGSTIFSIFAKLGDLKIPFIENGIQKIKDMFSGDLVENLLNFGTVLFGCSKRFAEFAEAVKSSKWGNAFGVVIQNILDKLGGLRNRLFEYISNVGVEKLLHPKELLESIDLNTVLTTGYTKLLTYLLTLVENVKTKFEEFQSVSSGAISTVFQNVKNIFTKIKTWLTEGGGTVLLSIGYMAMLMKMISTISGVLSKLDNILDFKAFGFDEIAEGITGFLKSLGKAELLEAKSKMILSVAEAIAILAAAVFVLSYANQDQMLKAAGVVAGLMALLAILVKVVTMCVDKMDGKTFAGFAAVILALGVSLRIVSSSLKVLETIPADRYAELGIKLLGLLTILIGTAAILSKTAPKLSQGAIGLIPMTMSIALLAKSLAKLGDIRVRDLGGVVGLIVAVTASMGALLFLSKGMTGFSAVALIAMVLSIRLVINALGKIADIDVAELAKNVDAFKVVFGMLLAMLISTRIGAKGITSLGASMLGVAVGMVLIVNVMKKLKDVKTGDLAKSIIAIGSIMALIGQLILKNIPSDGTKDAAKLGLMMLAMAGAVAILSGSIIMLSGLDVAGLSSATLAIDSILAMMALIVYASKDASDTKSTLVAITGALVAISALAVIVSQIPAEDLTPGVLAIDSMLAALALVLSQSKNIDVKSFAVFYGLLIPIAALAVVVKMLGDINPESAIASALGISIMLATISVSIRLLSKQTFSLDIVKNLGTLTVVVGLLAGVLAIMSALNVQNAIENAIGLSTLLISLSVVVGILGVVGTFAPEVVAGMAALGILALAITAIASVLELLDEATSGASTKFLVDGLDVMSQIFAGIGKVIGSIYSGFAEGVTSQLPQIGTNLSDFMANISYFTDELSKIGSDVASGALNLASAIAALSAASIVDFISTFVTGKNVDSWAQCLESVGTGIYNFSVQTAKIKDYESMSKAARAAADIGTMLDDIPRHNGFLQLLTGDNDIGSFGTALESLGDSLVTFSQSAAKFSDEDKENVKRTVDIALAISDFAQQIPNDGGLWGKLAGDNNIAKFGTDAFSFVESLKGFAEKASGFTDADVDSVSRVTAVSMKISDFANSINGSIHIDYFGSDIENFILSLSRFSETSKKLNDVDYTAMDSAINFSKRILGFVKAYGTVTNTDMLLSLSQNLKDLGKAIHDYYTQVWDIDFSKLDSSTDSIANSLDKMKNVVNASKAGSDVTDKMSAGISGGTDKVSSAMTTVVNTTASAVDKCAPKVKTSAENMMGGVSKAISSKAPEIAAKAGSATSSAATAINEQRSKFYSSGQNLVDGEIAGMMSKRSELKAAAASLTSASLTTINKTADIHSPSRKTEWSGEMVGQGFINGLRSKIQNAASVSTNLGKTALSGMNSTIARISGIVENGLDTSPTITPVVDTSAARRGFGELNSLASRSSLLSLNASVRTARGSVVPSVSTMTYSESAEFTKAIKSLKTAVESNTGTSLTINGMTYSGTDEVASAINAITRAALMRKRG